MNASPHRRGRLRQLVTVGVVCVTAGAVFSPLVGSEAAPSLASARKAKSVILINGDGMGAAQREAGRLSLVGLDGRLQMDRMRYSGTMTTDSRDPAGYVTDSAAAATAWATRQKTYNGAVSVDVDGNPLPILSEVAKRARKSTGLVTTSQVTDASPAAFFSQTPDRDAQSDIARQYLEKSKPDVILGGGEDWWYPADDPGAYPDQPAEDPTEASKGTEGNLVDEAKGLGYTYVSTAAELEQAKGRKVLGLFANEELFQARVEGNGDVYSPVVPLSTMTQKALDVLSKDKQGFFLFVEEEGIDNFDQYNNAEKVLYAMAQLEATVAVARRYVARHPGTLLIVAGDHECGGLAIENMSTRDESGTGTSTEDGPFPIKGSDKTFMMDWTTTSHTDVPVPVSATGPGAKWLSGQHPNTYLHTVMARALR